MDLWLLKPGHRIRTRDGTEAEILSETEDGEWIRVRYLDGQDDPQFSGTDDLAHKDEVEALLGVVKRRTWAEKVIVVLHRVPEDGAFGAGYQAETMTGVPNNVTISGSGESSKEEAVDHLLGGLSLLGFRGRVTVEDYTESGPAERYEIDLSSED